MPSERLALVIWKFLYQTRRCYVYPLCQILRMGIGAQLASRHHLAKTPFGFLRRISVAVALAQFPRHWSRRSIQTAIAGLFFNVIKGVEVWTMEWRSRWRKRPSTSTDLSTMHQIWTSFTLSTSEISANIFKVQSGWILLETITSSPYEI